jgi:hypothetical protein
MPTGSVPATAVAAAALQVVSALSTAATTARMPPLSATSAQETLSVRGASWTIRKPPTSGTGSA